MDGRNCDERGGAATLPDSDLALAVADPKIERPSPAFQPGHAGSTPATGLRDCSTNSSMNPCAWRMRAAIGASGRLAAGSSA